jgi:hypothetical protein
LCFEVSKDKNRSQEEDVEPPQPPS